jgi:hypothetical protein
MIFRMRVRIAPSALTAAENLAYLARKVAAIDGRAARVPEKAADHMIRRDVGCSCLATALQLAGI